MAANESPIASSMAPAGPQRADRRVQAASPPAQSKRDKKRQYIKDKIAQLKDKTARDRDPQFREMLQKIQFDASLVSKFDPYADRALDELEAEYQQSATQASAGQRSILEMTGPGFEGFFHSAADCIERKDYYLTQWKSEYEKKVEELQNTYKYKKEVATREWRALARTVRDRMINAISGKKYRLSKEKEAMEISDASALLLHPNQFSLAHPSSPGGTHSKRATRLRREMDDGQAPAESKKRKRNGTDEDGSPVPQRRALDPSSTTAIWQGDRLSFRKVEGPIYSIDKLFTDKELSMTYNNAAVAAHRHILTQKTRLDENGQALSPPDGSESGGEGDDQEGSESLPSAPVMERNMSRATRSAGQTLAQANFTDDKVLGVEAITTLEIPANLERLITADPKLPPAFPSTYIKAHAKASDFNTPPILSQEDISSDLAIMNTFRQYDQSHGAGSSLDHPNGAKRLLEAVAPAEGRPKYVAVLEGQKPRPSPNEVRRRMGMPLVIEPEGQPAPTGLERAQAPSSSQNAGQAPSSTPTGAVGLAQSLGGVAMSRQSSANGTPMSRTSSRKGRAGRG